MQHDYEQLGDRRFQQFCQALLLTEYPGLTCLPVGMPDGGRDGLVELAPEASEGSGILVFQVKFVERPAFLKDPTTWIQEILEGEREKVEALLQRGAERYVVITNVPASSHLDDGSVDRVRAVLANTLSIPAQCLWRGDLDRRLENHWDLKWSYPELMTGTDLIHALVEGRLSEAGERRARALRAFLADQYRKDHEVRFKQVDLRNDLLDVFIDVPASVQHKRNDDLGPLDRRLRFLARRDAIDADDFYGPHGTAGAGTLLLDPWVQERALKLVVEGAPGQGKSTMVQYVCQVHRMRLLSKDEDLARLPDEHREGGVRVPFRIELRELAQWLAGVDPFSADDRVPAPRERTLEGFVAALVRSASGGADFDISDLQAITAVSPVFLALDGLDEVVDVGDRSEIVEEISRAINRLDAIGASLQVVVTSRPASFTMAGHFAAPFEYLMLMSITRRLIGVYRDRWLSARDLDASESQELSATLDEKLDQPHFRDLCRNPMQLAIVLSLLHRKGPALPEQRTDLYRSYMEYFLDREAAKSKAVRDHRELLLLLHGHIACLLHIEAERSPRQAGRISTKELIQTAENFVASRGHERDLFKDLVGGVFDRFGALVSRVQDTFEFEVQPLREYFAGYYLYVTAPYSPTGREHTGTRPERLEAMLPHRFWLNVARFYAGCYDVGELESLAGRLEALADNDELRWTALPRTVTAQLLADWTLVQDRRAHRRAVGVMLRDLGARHAGSGEDHERPDFQNGPFVLPAKSGGAELLDALFEAASGPFGRGSRLSAIARALVANASPTDLAERWLKGASALGAKNESQWWRLGEKIAVFRAMSRDQIVELLGSSSADSSKLLAVVSSGVFWPADESPASGSAAIDHLLSSGSIAYGAGSSHPLVALDAMTKLDQIVMAKEMGYYFYDYYGQDWALPKGAWPEHYDHVIALTECYNTWQQKHCIWTQQLRPWVDIVDTGRALFGERDAFDRLALLSSAVRDGSRRGGGHPELHDSSKSLVLRARYARYRGRAVDWWRDQLIGAPDKRSERIAITLVLAWATSTTIESLEVELADRVNAMPSQRYIQLCADVENLSQFCQGRKRQWVSVKIRTSSARLFTVVEPRQPNRDSRELYRRANYDAIQQDWPVLMLVLRRELEFATADRRSDSWDRVLTLLRQAAKMGSLDLDYMGLPRSFRDMPEGMAKEIVRHADRYPLYAVEVAESKLAQVAVSKTLPVGQVAIRDRWFSEGV